MLDIKQLKKCYTEDKIFKMKIYYLVSEHGVYCYQFEGIYRPLTFGNLKSLDDFLDTHDIRVKSATCKWLPRQKFGYEEEYFEE